MVFHPIFNNSSVTSCQPVLFVGKPEKTIELSQVTDNLNHINCIKYCTPPHEWNSNYHTIITMTTPAYTCDQTVILYLQVNNEELREASHDYAIQVLRQTPATVGILVFRDDNQVKEEDIYDIFTVELNKKQGRGLGLSIVGKRNDVGVYISDIVSVSGNTVMLIYRNGIKKMSDVWHISLIEMIFRRFY